MNENTIKLGEKGRYYGTRGYYSKDKEKVSGMENLNVNKMGEQKEKMPILDTVDSVLGFHSDDSDPFISETSSDVYKGAMHDGEIQADFILRNEDNAEKDFVDLSREEIEVMSEYYQDQEEYHLENGLSYGTRRVAMILNCTEQMVRKYTEYYGEFLEDYSRLKGDKRSFTKKDIQKLQYILSRKKDMKLNTEQMRRYLRTKGQDEAFMMEGKSHFEQFVDAVSNRVFEMLIAEFKKTENSIEELALLDQNTSKTLVQIEEYIENGEKELKHVNKRLNEISLSVEKENEKMEEKMIKLVTKSVELTTESVSSAIEKQLSDLHKYSQDDLISLEQNNRQQQLNIDELKNQMEKLQEELDNLKENQSAMEENRKRKGLFRFLKS